MKISFDKAATRKLELWATHLGVNIDEKPETLSAVISGFLLVFVESELDKLKPATGQEKGVGA